MMQMGSITSSPSNHGTITRHAGSDGSSSFYRILATIGAAVLASSVALCLYRRWKRRRRAARRSDDEAHESILHAHRDAANTEARLPVSTLPDCANVTEDKALKGIQSDRKNPRRHGMSSGVPSGARPKKSRPGKFQVSSEVSEGKTPPTRRTKVRSRSLGDESSGNKASTGARRKKGVRQRDGIVFSECETSVGARSKDSSYMQKGNASQGGQSATKKQRKEDYSADCHDVHGCEESQEARENDFSVYDENLMSLAVDGREREDTSPRGHEEVLDGEKSEPLKDRFEMAERKTEIQHPIVATEDRSEIRDIQAQVKRDIECLKRVVPIILEHVSAAMREMTNERLAATEREREFQTLIDAEDRRELLARAKRERIFLDQVVAERENELVLPLVDGQEIDCYEPGANNYRDDAIGDHDDDNDDDKFQ